ncbi:hypothetical protein EV363DRAFT_1162886, partial [Boletus edulis]
PEGDGNERDVETIALRRGRRPRGQIEVQEVERDGERDCKREIDTDGVHMDGRQWGMTATTSAARRESKRLEMDALAEYKASQHRKCNRTTTDVPEASKPPHHYPRSPTDHANPPRRRGRLKSTPRSVNHTKWTHQVTKPRWDQIGRIGHAVHNVNGP